MIKTTRDLRPGDIIYIRSKRAVVEMITEDDETYHIRHSLGEGWYKSNGQWLVEEPLDDVIREAEILAGMKKNERSCAS